MPFDWRFFLLSNYFFLPWSLSFHIISEVKVEVDFRFIFLAIINEFILLSLQPFFLLFVQQLQLFPCPVFQVFLEVFIFPWLLHFLHIPFHLPSLLISLILKDSLLSLIGLILDLSGQVDWLGIKLLDSLWVPRIGLFFPSFIPKVDNGFSLPLLPLIPWIRQSIIPLLILSLRLTEIDSPLSLKLLNSTRQPTLQSLQFFLINFDIRHLNPILLTNNSEIV